MFLYTIVPIEDVLEGFDEDNRKVMIIQRGRLTMEVEPFKGLTGRIVRVVSSDPADFLDEQWQPGNLVGLTNDDFVE